MDAGAGPLSYTEVDGVPVVFAAGPPPLTAALLFRVGRADEAPPSAGISHAVEHLTLSTLGKVMYGYNGHVEPLFTVFHASGRPDELTEFLDRVCRTLGNLPLDRFDHEIRVLRTEAHGRDGGGGLIGMHLVNRYGAKGLGMLAFSENGLFRLAEDDVAAHAASAFTAGNAALWISGPVPDGLRLPLPAGERRPLPRAAVIEPSLPAFMQLWNSPLSISYTRARSEAGFSLDALLTARLWSRMRDTEGLSYSVQSWTELADPTTMVSVLWADALPDNAERAAAALVGAFEEMAADGPTAAELAEHIERGRRAWNDPLGIPGRLDRIARRLAVGDIADDEQLLARLEAVDAEAVRSQAEAAIATALVVLPPDAEVPSDRFGPLIVASPSAVTGKRFSACDPALYDRPLPPVLTVGGEGITYERGDGTLITVYWRSCALVERYDNGARVVVGDDAVRIDVLPWQWRQSDRLLAAIDKAVDPGVVVPVPGAAPAPKAPRLRRLWSRAKVRSWALGIGFAFTAFMALSGFILMVDPDVPEDRAGGVAMLVVSVVPAAVIGWELTARALERWQRPSG